MAITLVIIQFHSKTHGPFNVKKQFGVFLSFPVISTLAHIRKIYYLASPYDFICIRVKKISYSAIFLCI
jgi:hypothetical protein